MIGIIGKNVLKLALASASIGAIALSTAPVSAQQTTRSFDIPAQSLSAALLEFSKQSDTLIMASRELTEGKRSRPLKGNMPVNEAIARLLAGSGLRAVPNPDGGYRVESASARTASSGASDESASSMGGADAGSVQAGESGAEIVVTAQKRTERLLDVPVPVTAIGAQSLVANNQLRLQDYYTTVPGLNLTLGNRSEPFVAIRGVTTYGGNPTVGFVVDDVPYGSSTAAGGGFIAPDVDPSDLERVEVLRGPQGTLYGSNSLGGLIKYVTVDPSVERLSGRIEAGLNGVHNGTEVGYSLRGSINAPLSNNLALRASAFTRRESGYIDQPALRREGVNDIRARGGRLGLFWKPSETVSVKLSALMQRYARGGSPNIDNLPGVGDLEQVDIADTGQTKNRLQAYSGTIVLDLGAVNITSLTGYSLNRNYNSIDFSSALGTILTQPRLGVTGTPNVENIRTAKFSQELRLSGSIGPSIDWLVGGFYTDENSRTLAQILGSNPTTGAIVGTLWNSDVKNFYNEHSIFGNVTFKLTRQFDIQVGGRRSWDKQSFSSVTSGPYNTFIGVPSPNVIPGFSAKEHAFTYLVTPRFRLSPHIMVYGRLASGFRAGGLNPSPTVPRQFLPDKTENYELGLKGDLFDRLLTFEGSIYRIDWKDIQVRVTAPVTFQNYNTNGSRARSEGAELSADLRPWTGMRMSGWLAYNKARLTGDFPAGSTVSGLRGDRLPFSGRWSGRISVDQSFGLGDDLELSVGSSVNFVDDRKGQFVRSRIRQDFPGYEQIDLHFGLAYEDWKANVFLNNVSDKRGLLSGGIGSFPAYGLNVIQPRTLGLTVSKTF